MKGSGYLARHWRGELSLPVSFWVNNLLWSILAGLAIGGLAAWIGVAGDGVRAGALAILLAWPALLATNVWATVGAWRASGAYLAGGGRVLWGWGARVLLAIGALGTLVSTVADFGPQVGTYLQMARGIDPIGHLQVTLSLDGRRLHLEGPVGMGDARRVQALAARAPGLRLVELDSPGGRLKEAAALAALVRASAWQTRTVGVCESACTLIHLAGSRRQLMPGAKLGFHRASGGTLNPVLDRLANHELERTYRAAGLSDHLLTRAMATPPSRMWHPARDELVAGGLITVPERPLDIELPSALPAPTAELVDALMANETWFALERRFPGTVAEAAARVAELPAAGLTAEAAQVAAQQAVAPRIVALLQAASAETRELYLGLFGAQLDAAQAADAPSCLGVLALDAGARRALPPALARREAAWILDAAAEIPRDGPPRASTTLEREVMRRRLGDRAPALLDRLWRPGATDRTPADCDQALALIAAVAALPGAERKLATRLAFEQP